MLTAARNYVAFALLIVGMLYFGSTRRSGVPATVDPVEPHTAQAAKGYPAAAPQPKVADCASCPIPVPVDRQTRRAVQDDRVFYFLNETCETQWRATTRPVVRRR